MSEQIEIFAEQNQNNLSICHDCDALLLIPELNRTETAYCPICDGLIDEGGNIAFNRLLPLTITGFILFILANLYPLLSMNANGQIVDGTILSASTALWNGDQRFLSIVVFITTFLTPLLQLLANAWLLLPLPFGRILPFSDSVLRVSHHSVPWNMMEIFLLGFIIAVVKLGEEAVIILGPSLYAFVALILLMTVLNNLFDPAEVRKEIQLADKIRNQSWTT